MAERTEPLPWRSDLLPLIKALAAALLTVVAVATLYLGREVFVPLALAILLSFVLAPLVRLLQRWRVPRSAAVVGVVLLAFAGLFTLGTVMASQVAELAADLPQYQATMREKVRALRGVAAGSGTLERAADMLQDLGREFERPKDRAAGPGNPLGPDRPAGQEPTPIPVEIRQPDPGALQTLAILIAPLVHPLATTGIIVIFVIFILMQREDLRNRLIRLAGSRDIQRTTAAIDDAAHRLSRLFLTQLALNAGFGVVIGLGLWLIGVPSPILWGMLATVLRFVPYIGAIISAAFPLALAAAVDPGWSMLLWTAALFLVVEPLVGHVIEPLVYGHSTGLSPVAVVLSATFWTWLWGPIGLVLATPLTVCLVVLGRHVERLEFLDVMFGDRPALSQPQIFYQRMLAGDPTEATEQAEEFLEQGSLSAYYETVALEGLRLAQADVARGSVDRSRALTVRDAVRELVDDLADEDDRQPDVAVAELSSEPAADEDAREARPAVDLPVLRPEELASAWRSETPVLCIAGRGPLDEAVALILAQLLDKHGLRAKVLGADALATANLFRLDAAGVAMVCLSFLDTSSPVHVRYTVRRVRRKVPRAMIMAGIWQGDDQKDAIEMIRASAKADIIVTSLRDALAAAIEASTAAVEPQEARPNAMAAAS